MLKQIPWLKIVGWSLLIHVALIGFSFLEVFIYSIFINPGQEESIYEAHAQLSAPYVAIILGIPIFYLVARHLAKKHVGVEISIGIWLAIAYIVIDLLILIPFQTDWSSHWWILLLSFSTKFGASYLGARSVVKKLAS